MKIILATGGSGGHLFPAIKVAESLRQKGYKTLFIGSFAMTRDHLTKRGLDYIDLNLKGINLRDIKGTVQAIWLSVKAFFTTVSLLRKVKPNAVCGFGGFSSFAVVCAAKFLRIPCLIHEQNVLPGRANKILAKLADEILISFSQTFNYFNKKKTMHVGCPIQAKKTNCSREQLLRQFNLSVDLKTIFVFGGSQGSVQINRVFTKACELLKKDFNFQVIHLCGKNDYEQMKKYYSTSNIKYALFTFLENIAEALEVCDLVISRSGAVSVTEISAFKVPSILIPYPHASGHQLANAKVLTDKGMAFLLEDKDLTEHRLRDIVIKAINNRENIINKLNSDDNDINFSNAAERISEEMIKLAR